MFYYCSVEFTTNKTSFAKSTADNIPSIMKYITGYTFNKPFNSESWFMISMHYSPTDR